MTAYENGTASTLPPTSVRLLLGLVLIVGGIFVLGDVALATVISAIVIGVTAIVVGAFEMMHAFWMKGWGGFIQFQWKDDERLRTSQVRASPHSPCSRPTASRAICRSAAS